MRPPYPRPNFHPTPGRLAGKIWRGRLQPDGYTGFLVEEEFLIPDEFGVMVDSRSDTYEWNPMTAWGAGPGNRT